MRTTITSIAKLAYYFNSHKLPEAEKNCFHNKYEMTVLGKPQILNPGNRNCHLSIFVMKNITVSLLFSNLNKSLLTSFCNIFFHLYFPLQVFDFGFKTKKYLN